MNMGNSQRVADFIIFSKRINNLNWRMKDLGLIQKQNAEKMGVKN